MPINFINDISKEVNEIQDRNPHLLPDNAFVVWFLRAFICENENSAVGSISGKSSDKGVDAVYIDHQNKIVFIIQGKYHLSSTPSAKHSDIIALADIGRCLLLEKRESFESLTNGANASVRERLIEARKMLQQKGYTLTLNFVTTGKVSSVHIQEAEKKLEDFENCRFQSYSKSDLQKLMQDYLEGAAPPVPTLNLPISGTEVFSRTDKKTNITSWIFTMKGMEIGDLFNSTGIRLFSRNIRGYLGNTEINKVMRYTIDNEPEHFWYFNNGITIVCDVAKQIKSNTSNKLQVLNAQIINGQQTTRTLSLVQNNKTEVLVKVIQIPRGNKENQEQYRHIVGEIVSATNWQNAISQSDLKSNDAEQVRIEREFKKFNYFYVRKQMSKAESIKYGSDKYVFKINKFELARALAAITIDPYEIRAGKDRLFEDDVYSLIFNGRSASQYLAIYWIYRHVNYHSKLSDLNSYSKWQVMSIIWSSIHKDFQKNTTRSNFLKMAERPKKYSSQLGPLDQLIKQYFKIAKSFYSRNKRSYGKLQVPRDYFKHAGLVEEINKFMKQNAKSSLIRIDRLKVVFLKNCEEIEYHG